MSFSQRDKMFAVFAVTFLALGVSTGWFVNNNSDAIAKTEFESQDTKHLLTSQDAQTAAIMASVLAGHLDTESVYFSAADSQITRYIDKINYCYYNVTDKLCAPHKDSVSNPFQPKLFIRGASGHVDQDIEIQFRPSPDFKCSDIGTITLTPPKHTELDSYETNFSSCTAKIIDLRIIGEWTWHLTDHPEMRGIIHVVDVHSIFGKYADFVN